MKRLSLLFGSVMLMLLAGCSSFRSYTPRPPSYAISSYRVTEIGRIIEKEAAKHPGRSGFGIVRYGREAFTARIAMTDLTQKTLDLQYYLWDDDDTGRLLALHTLNAAERGVKVRILLDDIGLQGRDRFIAVMDAHPNIEIRIFNPFGSRNIHLFDFLTDIDRVNHRMHNKTVIMDNAFAIVGGRNIGDHYFGVSDKINFRDLDIAAVGPVVREVSKMYDYFWNGRWSVPISEITQKQYSRSDIEKLRKRLEKRIVSGHYPYPLNADSKRLQQSLKQMTRRLVWAKGEILWNDPEQMKLPREKQTHTMISQLHERLKKVRRSLLVESAYFIPRRSGVEALVTLRKRGVKVRILTNSLKSNDVLAAYAGYRNYRKILLAEGVEIYELRDDAGSSTIINHHPAKVKVRTGLHAKAMVFDGEDVFVGSFNLDPRSSRINTEGGLYVESTRLAREVTAFMDEGIDLHNAYRLGLDAKGNITWTTIEKGKEVVYTSEPKVGIWDAFKVNMLQMLPMEDQL